jgi:hypothetical protein
MTSAFSLCGIDLVQRGGFARILRLQNEFYDPIPDAKKLVNAVLESNEVSADIFTFVQDVARTEPKYDYHMEPSAQAILRLATYDHWWKKQISDKTRNMVRKAPKAGVEIRVVPFSDEVVNGIMEIYDESPLRQGRPFLHYKKGFAAIRASHITYVDRSEFIGAFYQGKMIGFIKLVHSDGFSNLMQILSMVQHREKAPTNALIAKAVEICTQRQVPILHYGMWSRRSMGEFKIRHGFERVEVPRYFVPLTVRGRLLMSLGFHRPLKERLPETCVDKLVDVRSRFRSRKAAA